MKKFTHYMYWKAKELAEAHGLTTITACKSRPEVMHLYCNGQLVGVHVFKQEEDKNGDMQVGQTVMMSPRRVEAGLDEWVIWDKDGELFDHQWAEICEEAGACKVTLLLDDGEKCGARFLHDEEGVWIATYSLGEFKTEPTVGKQSAADAELDLGMEEVTVWVKS